MKIAILDDYQNIALKLADWSTLARRAEITVFNDHIADPAAIIDRLLPFDVVCVMRNARRYHATSSNASRGSS